jgi:EAL domain-containing protein (putative c-di-GMP-specific phosphodiesterase class I)
LGYRQNRRNYFLETFACKGFGHDESAATDVEMYHKLRSVRRLGLPTVVNIASARNMTTTAEGVETEAQKELLRSLGCTEMQGYLFSPAKPAAEIRGLLMLGQSRVGAVA